MTDGIDNPNVTLEELRIKVEAMKRMMESGQMEEERKKNRRKASCRASIIDGTFLSIVYMIVLILIISVALYAFTNLFLALRKKYPGQDSEL